MSQGADLVDAAPRGERVHRFTLRYDNQQHYHRCMRMSGAPIYVQLDWRESAASPVKPVGLYRLNLRELLAGGFIRLEHPEKPNEVRVRVVRTAMGGFLIQTGRAAPELSLEQPKIEWW
jgi:hypothetical protein